MIKKFSRLATIAAIMLSLTATITSCKKDNFDEPPANTVDPQLDTTHTLARFRSLYSGGLPMTITDDIVIQGLVIADDRSGNLYKQIVIDDGTAGITILIDKTTLYSEFPVGRKIYVKCKGLVLGNYHNFVQLGGYIDNTSGQPEVGNIPATLTDNYIVKGPSGNDISSLIQDVTIPALNNSFQSRLVRIADVEFTESDANQTYADILTQESLSRVLTNCGGQEIEVRTSNFAKFANVKTPKGKGTIMGIYSVYNSDKQLTIRDTSDVNLRGIKCDGTDPNALVLFEETFNGVADPNNTVLNLAGWMNVNEVGPNKFKVAKFSSVICVKADMFSISNGNPSTQWLITPPINMDGSTGEALTFSSAAGFDNGNATLQALISTNYDGSGSPQSFTWTVLPATIATGPGSGFGSFISSGSIDLSSYNGNVYIAFKYAGTSPATTFEVDNVKVTGL